MSAQRHTLHGQCLILLIAGAAYGQWDTNVWPAYLHPRSQRIQFSQCYTALHERAIASYDHTNSYPVAPTWYRFQRGNLIELKKGFRRLLGEGTGVGTYHLPVSGRRWVDKGAVTNGLIESVRETGQILAFTKQALCAYAKRPTNYFDYTPYRGIDGIGPFTNDASVGRPHGWTNEYTAAGGPNYPEGRSCWYTTDYGIDGIRDMITNLNELVYLRNGTSSNGTIDSVGYYLVATTAVYYGSSTGSKPLADAKAEAEANYVKLSGYYDYQFNYPGQQSFITTYSPTTYAAHIWSFSNSVYSVGPMDYSNPSSNVVTKITDSKFLVELLGESQDFGANEYVFDGLSAWPDRSNTWHESSAAFMTSPANSNIVAMSSSVSVTNMPYWGDEPASNTTVNCWVFDKYGSRFWMYAKYDFDFK